MQETHLVHASICEEQSGVIEGDGGGRVPIAVPLLLEELNELLPHIVGC